MKKELHSTDKCLLDYDEGGYLTCTYNHAIGEECLMNTMFTRKMENVVKAKDELVDAVARQVKPLFTLLVNFLMWQDKEIVICAAVRMPDGYIVRGHRHMDCIRTARGIPRYKDMADNYETPHGKEQGFMTSRNRYVDRDEGLALQLAAGIESAAKAHGDDYRGQLYSEDLY